MIKWAWQENTWDYLTVRSGSGGAQIAGCDPANEQETFSDITLKPSEK